MTDNNEYAILFYKEERIVGVSSITSTLDEVRGVTNLMANSEGDYLPNSGDYNLVGFMKAHDINVLLPKVIEEYDQQNKEGK
jgi:hypothetical protein